MPRLVLFFALSSLVCPAAHADCIADAAQHHGVNAHVLRAIGWQESRLNPEALHRNANGTVDFGAFQINSIHLRNLRGAGITPHALRDGCVSAYVAAWHYRRQVERYGNSWSAVGAYHSISPRLNHAYADSIAAILMSWGILAPGALPFPPEARLPAKRQRSNSRGPSRPVEDRAIADNDAVLDASAEPTASQSRADIARR